MTALLVLRNKAIKPLLAAAQPLRPTRGAQNPKPIESEYGPRHAAYDRKKLRGKQIVRRIGHTRRYAMKAVFHELGPAA